MQSKHGFETTGQRSALMAKIKSNNTKAEVKLRKALFAKGMRFRVNNSSLFGKPDISIKKFKLVIFIDGEFWHGYNWDQKKEKIITNRAYWIPKIERNINRDLLVNDYYYKLGWTLFRFWEKEVNRNLDGCVNEVLNFVKSL